jgi:hypothetical protein
MAKDDATNWIDEGLAALSEPEQASKAEIGLTVNKVERAFEEYGSNPAPGEYESLLDELNQSEPDGERCRQFLKKIRDRLSSTS